MRDPIVFPIALLVLLLLLQHYSEVPGRTSQKIIEKTAMATE